MEESIVDKPWTSDKYMPDILKEKLKLMGPFAERGCDICQTRVIICIHELSLNIWIYDFQTI